MSKADVIEIEGVVSREAPEMQCLKWNLRTDISFLHISAEN